MIYKATFTVSVLGRFDSEDKARATFENGDLESLLREASDGVLISDCDRNPPAIEFVPPANVKDELVAIGNDGSFFDYDLDEIGDPHDVLGALKALLDWGREFTGPEEANTPHDLLVRAANAIARAEGRE